MPRVTREDGDPRLGRGSLEPGGSSPRAGPEKRFDRLAVLVQDVTILPAGLLIAGTFVSIYVGCSRCAEGLVAALMVFVLPFCLAWCWTCVRARPELDLDLARSWRRVREEPKARWLMVGAIVVAALAALAVSIGD